MNPNSRICAPRQSTQILFPYQTIQRRSVRASAPIFNRGLSPSPRLPMNRTNCLRTSIYLYQSVVSDEIPLPNKSQKISTFCPKRSPACHLPRTLLSKQPIAYAPLSRQSHRHLQSFVVFAIFSGFLANTSRPRYLCTTQKNLLRWMIFSAVQCLSKNPLMQDSTIHTQTETHSSLATGTGTGVYRSLNKVLPNSSRS